MLRAPATTKRRCLKIAQSANERQRLFIWEISVEKQQCAGVESRRNVENHPESTANQRRSRMVFRYSIVGNPIARPETPSEPRDRFPSDGFGFYGVA